MSLTASNPAFYKVFGSIHSVGQTGIPELETAEGQEEGQNKERPRPNIKMDTMCFHDRLLPNPPTCRARPATPTPLSLPFESQAAPAPKSAAAPAAGSLRGESGGLARCSLCFVSAFLYGVYQVLKDFKGF